MRTRLRILLTCLLGLGPLTVFAQQGPPSAAGQSAGGHQPWITFESSQGGRYYFHYSLRVETDGRGEVTMTPHAIGEPDTVAPWSASFQLTPTSVGRLEQLFTRNRLFTTQWRSAPPMPCGPAGILRIQDGTRQVALWEAAPSDQESLAAAIIGGVRAIVPSTIQSDLDAKWQAYIAALR